MSAKFLYPLTDFERMLLNINKCGDSIVMGIAFVKNTSETAQLTEIMAKHALNILQRRHPFFRAFLNEQFEIQIQDENYEPIELEWSNDYVIRSDLITQLEIFNSRIFDFKPKSNLVRSKILSFVDDVGEKLIAINLALALIITDGINITAVTIELVNILNALMTNSSCKEMENVLDPIESLHYYTEKYKMIGEKQKETIEFISKLKPVEFLLPKEFRKYNETGFKLNLFKIDKELTQKIIKKTKENNIKLSGFLDTAAYYALHDLYTENGLDFPKLALIENPANLRMRYNPPMDFSDLRMQVSITGVTMSQEELSGFTDIWKDSVNTHKQLVQMTDLETGTIFCGSHDFEYIEKKIKIFNESSDLKNASQNFNKTLGCDLAVSNIGSYVWNKNMVLSGPLEILESYFSDSLQTNPHAICGLIFHIGFWKDQIMIQLSSNKHAIGSVFVERYIELLLIQLKNSV